MKLRRMSGFSKFAAGSVAAAVLGGLGGTPNSVWYANLRKPGFQPPSAAFPVAWTILYADIAVVSTLVVNRLEADGQFEEARGFRRAWLANMALNTAWTWLFFRSRSLWIATADCGVLTVSCIDLARRAGRADVRLGAALSPYAAWTTFATFLSGTIATLNN